ncbi:hypothetical protein G4B88_001664 [Cannabis sativa]|uniref:Uncharacterized protein n=1 Tax=Cannabis sativa TaxID=3483 RepID=A0A7J6I489_CANSA|nr:hypothetical protein G4B88_001664 [Cannabis sativa]
MRRILGTVTTSVSTTDRDLIKELKRMADHLSEVDRNVDDEQLPTQDQANLIFGRLEVYFNLDPTISDKTIQSPIPRSTKPKRGKRQVRQQETSSSSEEEEEERSPTSIVPVNRQSERATRNNVVVAEGTNVCCMKLERTQAHSSARPSLPGSPRASFTISVTSLARPSFTISVPLLALKSLKLKKSARLSTRTSFLLLMISDLFSPKSSLSDSNSKLQTVGVPHLSSLDAFVEARNTGRT